MITMYALREVLGRLEVRYFVSRQFRPAEYMWKMNMGQQTKTKLYAQLWSPPFYFVARAAEIK